MSAPAEIEADVVVVGFGAAGAVAALEAARAGARTVLLEKMPFPGGISTASAGGIRITDRPEAALAYLQASCGGRTPDDILADFAEGMAGVGAWVQALAAPLGVTVTLKPGLGNYPLPGYDALGYCEVTHVPQLEGQAAHHAMAPIKNGTRLFWLLEQHVHRAGVRVHLNAPARRLVTDAAGRVAGVLAEIDGRPVRIAARQGVILACGGFEADPEMQRQYLQMGALRPGSFLGNTGDGIRMAQAVGADLWHMWHVHGPYGLVHPDPDYPFGVYLKAVPMWTPGHTERLSSLGLEGDPLAGATRRLPPLAWILVDAEGRRFMDEYPPYPGDTGLRPFDLFDFPQQRFARRPAFMIFDDRGRALYPLGRTVHNDPRPRHAWSADNHAEIAAGFFHSAETLEGLAEGMGVPAAALEATVARWNAACAEGQDADFGRQPETMLPIATPPFHFGRVQPILINTQGGPRHDRHQRVLDPFGAPIPGLYAAGELGSLFGHVYLSGGNLAECIIGGRTAARHATAAAVPA